MPREAPPTTLSGPVLIFEALRGSGASFLCSACRKDFKTQDAQEGFDRFRVHKCPKRTSIGGSILAPVV